MRKTLIRLASILVLATASASALSQPYPSKPIRIVVGYAPGGGFDIAARLLGVKMQETWGQPVVIENKVGADSIIATDFVAKSAPDGYTLLLNGNGGMVVNAVLYPKLPYDPVRDFSPISQLLSYPYVLLIHSSVPAQTVQEFIAYARANPGKLNYSAGSRGFQLAHEMFKQMTGTVINHIPYKGSAPAFNALIAGEVHMSLTEVSQAVSHMNRGKVKGLAVSSAKRLGTLPEIPTLAESGLPEYEFEGWSGLFAAAGTPSQIISKLNAEIVRIVNFPDVREKLTAGGVVLKSSTSEQFAATVRNDIERYRPVVKAANMKAD